MIRKYCSFCKLNITIPSVEEDTLIVILTKRHERMRNTRYGKSVGKRPHAPVRVIVMFSALAIVVSVVPALSVVSLSRQHPRTPIMSLQGNSAPSNGFSAFVEQNNNSAGKPRTADSRIRSTTRDSTPSLFTQWTNRNMSMVEMMGMNVVGVGLTATVVYSLANTNEGLEATTENLGEVGLNIMDAAFPLSAENVVSVTLGEVAAGAVAALTSFGLMNAMRLFTRRQSRQDEAMQAAQAVGNGDFLVAKAAAFPLLESLGIPIAVARVLSSVFAAVPAEIVKTGMKQKNARKERELLQQLLEEEEWRKQQSRSFFLLGTSRQAATTTPPPDLLLEEIRNNQQKSIVVDVVADLIKWLGYSVLSTDFGGRLTWNGLPLFPGLESAIFGAIAALSAQVYADVLFAYFGFGGKEKQDKIQSRTALAWLTAYLDQASNAATLFGVYEFAQIPAKAAVSAILSQGADGCYGSQDYDLCIETYLFENPPGASPEAQLRSLVTTLVSLWNRLSPFT